MAPSRKQADQADKKTGPRRISGTLLSDMVGMGAQLGLTQKALYNRVARGEIPHRKLQGRIVFVRTEIEAFLAALPGVSLEEALSNLAARRGEAP